MKENRFQHTTQILLPVYKPDTRKEEYDIYPVFDIGEDKISTSLETLFAELPSDKLILVEGNSIILQCQSGYRTRFNYAETFIVPAAGGTYTIVNESGSEAKLIKAFVK